MGARNTSEQWGWVAKTLHWATALGVIGLVIVGLWMDEMRVSPQKVKVFALHKSIGLSVLVEVHDVDEVPRALDAGARIIILAHLGRP